MGKRKTVLFALVFSLILTILVIALCPLISAIAESPLPRFFATKLAPEEVGFYGDSNNIVIYGSGYIITDGVVYRDNLLSDVVSFFPIYMLAVIYIVVILRFRPKACSLYVLPASFFMLPFLFFTGVIIFYPVLGYMFSMEVWAATLYQVIFPLYSIPLFFITLLIAILRRKINVAA